MQRGLHGSGAPDASAQRANPLEIPAGTAGTIDASRALPMAAAEQWLGALRAELAGAAPTDAARLERAAGRLLLAGEDGLAAARLALGEDDSVLLLTGARALLSSGRADARSAVAARMSGKLPVASALPLFDLLGALAPELLSDVQLVEWLAHPVGGVRSASEKALTRRAGPALVPVLHAGLGAGRSEARTRAVVLLERIGGPDALRAIRDALGDASTEVAQRAANALADAAGAVGADERRALLEQLREGRGLTRAQCYAVLALVLNEERAGELHFEARDAALFVPELRSAAPLSRVCAALVLAGLGWRWESAEPSDWLDRDVPHTLVRELSGSEFHADIAALAWPAQRRLQRISGENLGNDGPAWARWWVEAGPQFRARRTVLALPAERAGELVLRYRSLGEGLVFELCGPDAPAPSAEALRLTREQCEHLRARALELGLADARCEPGQRTVGAGFARILELELAGARKHFGFGQGAAEPWFEEACALVREAADAQAWQRLRDARAHASQAEFLSAEAEWWAREADP
ncbi:MAG: hypothetical protein FJ299_16855, partial [Planctomycetes bacterium]|nr:hypothetical protein [Planctomycetota bacterium]